ncbi:DNA-directed DNA polymerase II small subunit [Halogeometricum sp. S1BR25-6]|uniref:DNA polymerase II small subunit n=1 Tax=Halogeometricum salsisoli TaxID=2950536 RepID=A0ABU2GAU1_9EURY|nr:DNA-directed DNA polymerase II small subunit [Halogeometricum sp. S1BR25-6]MDS0297248.1 DNA-directed DNA polymerase II small subunit [Halogeometricum sp. S1BR25-6]
MPLETPARIVRELARHGYNAEREAVTLIAGAADPGTTLARAVERAGPDAFRVTAEDVRAVLDAGPNATDAPVSDPAAADSKTPADSTAADSAPTDSASTNSATPDPTTTDGGAAAERPADDADSPDSAPAPDPFASSGETDDGDSTGSKSAAPETEGNWPGRSQDTSLRSLDVANDMTGQSTGTGEYGDFVKVFKDRYEKLSRQLRGRVNHRPAEAIQSMSGGSDAAMVGLVNDIRSTASGHWLVELEDTTGTFPCLVMKDREFAAAVDELLLDECIAVEGTLADDAGIMFVDSMHSPDVPRTYKPSTADRHVQAALISDVHVGSQEFMTEAWQRFTSWLHTEEAEHVEYLLIAGDMVEGVGVYPNQDEELDIVDIYDQYEQFSEHLKEVPGDIEIVMIPGNHDAVRLAEPQPGFDENLRDIMSVHDARITSNPSTVTLEGVKVLMYHGVSLDEVIAELPAESASYDEPHKAMYQLLKKRHVAPQYGGHTRLAPEEKDYLVMEEVPDVFHTGHVHKLGWGKYHNVLAVNSGCWQAQTDFQKSVNIDPDAGYAPILDLDTLDMTVRKFS